MVGMTRDSLDASDSIEVNSREWLRPYFAPNPQSEIWRWWGWIGQQLLSQRFSGPDKLSTLEFGCGQAANVNFFHEQGLVSSGVDLNPDSIETAKTRYLHLASQLKVVPFHLDQGLFSPESFNQITSRHVLHFLPPEVFSQSLSILRTWLKDRGILYVTFMQVGGYYFNNSVPLDNGMRRVQFNNGRFDREVDVWFVNDEEDLKARFPDFHLIDLGESLDYFTRTEAPGDRYFCATFAAG